MFLLDTMVVSELRKGVRSHPAVRAWSARTPAPLQFISVISIQEMRRGAVQIRSKDSHQSAVLNHWIDGQILVQFAGRILPVDLAVAERSALLHVPTEREAMDMLIAATALVHDFTLVTRNLRHFEGTGVRILNPFT